MRKAIFSAFGIIAITLIGIIAILLALPKSIAYAATNESEASNVSVTGTGITEGNTYYLQWSSLSLVYNGNSQCPSVTLKCNEDNDYEKAATVIVKNVDGTSAIADNVGDYIAVAEFEELTFSEGDNERVFTISPLARAVDWEKTKSYTYNGNAQCPDASYVDANGNKKPLTAMGAGTDAGNYTASVEATSAGDNYTLTNLTYDYAINKRSVTVQWGKSSSYTYNGNVQGPTASYMDVSGSKITLTPSGLGVDAGPHTTSVTEDAAGENYLLIGNLTCEYSIEKFAGKVLWVVADYYIANGKSQGPRAFVVGVNGEILELPVKGFGVKSGEYTAEIDLSKVDSNFELTGNLSSSYNILPEKQFGPGGTALSIILGILLIGCGAAIAFLLVLRKKEITKRQSETDDSNCELKNLLEERDNRILWIEREKRSIKKIKDKLYYDLEDAKVSLSSMKEELDYANKQLIELKNQQKVDSADKKQIESLEYSVQSLTAQVKILTDENERLKTEKANVPDFYKHPIEDYFPEIDEAFERAKLCDYDSENPEWSYNSQRQELDTIMKWIAIYRSQRR